MLKKKMWNDLNLLIKQIEILLLRVLFFLMDVYVNNFFYDISRESFLYYVLL